MCIKNCILGRNEDHKKNKRKVWRKKYIEKKRQEKL